MTRAQLGRARSDGTAILQCGMWVSSSMDPADEARCQYDHVQGTLYCSLHQTRSLPPAAWRCQHRLVSPGAKGQQCTRSVPTRRRGKGHFCDSHGIVCPGSMKADGCGRLMVRTDTPLCRVCTARSREQHTCWIPDANDEPCGSPAKTPSTTCGKHDPAKWASEDRCTHRYGAPVPDDPVDVKRCPRRRHNVGGTACTLHRQPCAGCSKRTDQAEYDALCRRCRTCPGPCKAGHVPAGKTLCRWCDPGMPRCAGIGAATGKPCGRPVENDGPWCGRHGVELADADQCVVLDDGQRCRNPRQTERWSRAMCAGHFRRTSSAGQLEPLPVDDRDRGPDGRLRTVACQACGAATAAQLGLCPSCTTKTCMGTCANHDAAGTRCLRAPTREVDGMLLCKSHAKKYPTDQAFRCTGTIPAGNGSTLPCTEPRVPGLGPDTDRCKKVHGGRGRCPMLNAKGDSCPMAPMSNGLCGPHQGILTMAGEDRCVHRFADPIVGDDLDVGRCPQRSRGSHGNGFDVVCGNHLVPCLGGCGRRTADVIGGWCQRCRVTCSATVADLSQAIDGCYTDASKPCSKGVAVGEEMCEVHLTQQALHEMYAQCVHVFDNGERCMATPNGGAVDGDIEDDESWTFRVRCQTHALVCAESACGHRTQLPLGRCKWDYPRCIDTDGRAGACDRAGIAPDGRCGHHHAAVVFGTCALYNSSGEPCSHAATVTHAEGMICARHAASLPADKDRCAHVYPDQMKCASRRWDVRGWAWCGFHAVEHNIACGVIRWDRQLCTQPRMHLPYGELAPHCNAHVPVPDDERCTIAVTDFGTACPNRAEPWSWACRLHQGRAPRCTATPYDIHCPHPAMRNSARCESHPDWDPEWPWENPDEFERWFLMPNADLFWELVLLDADDSALSDPSRPTDVLSSVDTETQKECGMVSEAELALGDEPIVDNDPFDITGARLTALELIEGGMDSVIARESARIMAANWRPNTIKGRTSAVRGYLKFCKERGHTPIPATTAVLMSYFHYVKELGVRDPDDKKIRDYAPGTVDGFRQAIRAIHEARGLVDPFTQDKRLAYMARGVKKLNARVPVQAHAIRADELAQLVDACTRIDGVNSRDLLISALAHTSGRDADGEPETLTHSAIAGLRYQDVLFHDDGSMTVQYRYRANARPKPVTFDPLQTYAVQISEQEISTGLACPVHLLRSWIETQEVFVRGRHFRDDELLIPKENGTAMTKQNVALLLAKARKQAGFDPKDPDAFTGSIEDRLKIALYLDDPSLIALRDCAIMAIMWWASLRRGEIRNLTIGDLHADARGRGLLLLVRQDKTQMDGRFVPLPKTTLGGRTEQIHDPVRNLHRWLDAYRRIINRGRPLTDDMPLFPALGNVDLASADLSGQGGLGAEAVGLILKRWVDKTTITAELGEHLSMHGFRAGFATEWLTNGGDAVPLAKRQRRASVESVLGYFRLRDQFEDSLSHVLVLTDDGRIDIEAMIDKAVDQ